ncbi:MAG: putative abductin-like protein [Myxococcales bacterium]|nr:putative abductin-like protein [Myxococcales bacterium]
MDAIEIEGSQAIEVVAQFDGAIVAVTHLSARELDPRPTQFLVGGGVALMAVAAVAFVSAYAGARLGRGIDAVVIGCLIGGTWALLRGLDRRADRVARDYTIGGHAHADFAVAPGAVPLPRFPLVRVDEAGDFELTVADTMVGHVTVDGQRRPLESLTRASSLVAGARAQRLTAGARATVTLGNATFHVANVPAPRRQPRPFAIDWSREVYLGGTSLVVSAFLLLVFAIPPEGQALSLDLLHNDHYARFVITPPVEPPPRRLPGNPKDGGSPGAASAGPSGRLGKPNATHRNGILKLPGPVSREKRLAVAQIAASTSGIIGLLRDQGGSHVGSVFGPSSPLGDGAQQALDGLEATELHDGYGTGSSFVGPGHGGDGDKPGTIGSGPLGTVGLCPGCKAGDKSYARSAPVDDLEHHAKAPDIVPGPVNVKCGLNASCLDKEIVRRIVRQHRNEVRYCYERALVAKPELTGRIVTQFTIANTGRVLGSSVIESSLGDRGAEQCIAEAVRRWEFPSSAQMAVVSYPFMLTPPR